MILFPPQEGIINCVTLDSPLFPRDAQRVLTHQEAGLKASFLTLLLPEGRAISDPLPVKSASIERAGEAPFAESASRCASRGHIEREIVINRPVEEVFDFLADGRNEPQYNPHMLRAEQTSTGPVGPGTLFRTEVTTGRTIKGPIAVQSTETFAAGTAGTHFRWVMELEP